MRRGDNIVWGTCDDGDNIVWGTSATATTSCGAPPIWGDNIVWGTADLGDNIVWGTQRCRRSWCRCRWGLLMEKMPYQAHARRQRSSRRRGAEHRAARRGRLARRSADADRRSVTLRELRASDAPALFAALTNEQVSRFISPPPSTVDGFETFIAWTHRQRAAGSTSASRSCRADRTPRSACFRCARSSRRSAPPSGASRWRRSSGARACSSTARKLVVDFAFDVLGAHRLEARAAVKNGRGNGALRKLGAVQEGRPPPSRSCGNGELSRSGAVDDSRRGVASRRKPSRTSRTRSAHRIH